MVYWKKIILTMLSKRESTCKKNKCNGRNKLESDLALLIEDISKLSLDKTDYQIILEAVKAKCTNCVAANERAQDAYEIATIIRKARENYDELTKLAEDAIERKADKCFKCMRYPLAVEELVVAVSSFETNHFYSKEKINPLGKAATEMCIGELASGVTLACGEQPWLEGILQDVAEIFLEKKRKERENLRVRPIREMRERLLFEDKEEKIARLNKDPTFLWVVGIKHSPQKVEKMELEYLDICLKLLRTLGVEVINAKAIDMEKRWREYFEKGEIDKLDVEIKLVESIRILNSRGKTYYLYEKIDALDTILRYSKKSKEQIMKKLQEKANELTENEKNIIELIKIK